MNKADYYEVLGIPKNSSDDDIKKAYRKLAREHHPDMVKDSDKSAAEKRFKEINEAYQVLSDPQKRKMYDQFGHSASGAGFNQNSYNGYSQGNSGPFTYTYSSNSGNPFGAGTGYGDFDPFDVFEEFFGFRGFGGSKAKKGKNLYYEMNISFTEAVFGIEKEVKVESGNVLLKIPAGVHDGTEMRFAGKGMPGPQGVESGDLFITLRLKLPSEFQMVGETIVVIKTLDMVLAAVGGVLEVPTIDLSRKDGLGSTKLKIPAGTQYGTRFLIKGKGFPKLHNKGQGDIVVQVLVEIPKKLSKKQKELLELYQKS